MSQDHELLETIQRRLREYLDSNPDAADTIEGVEQWWIAPLPVDRRVRPALERALEAFVQEGRLVKRSGIDGKVLWATIRSPDPQHWKG